MLSAWVEDAPSRSAQVNEEDDKRCKWCHVAGVKFIDDKHCALELLLRIPQIQDNVSRPISDTVAETDTNNWGIPMAFRE